MAQHGTAGTAHHGVLHIRVLRAARQPGQQDEHGRVLRQLLQAPAEGSPDGWAEASRPEMGTAIPPAGCMLAGCAVFAQTVRAAACQLPACGQTGRRAGAVSACLGAGPAPAAGHAARLPCWAWQRVSSVQPDTLHIAERFLRRRQGRLCRCFGLPCPSAGPRCPTQRTRRPACAAPPAHTAHAASSCAGHGRGGRCPSRGPRGGRGCGSNAIARKLRALQQCCNDSAFACRKRAAATPCTGSTWHTQRQQAITRGHMRRHVRHGSARSLHT